MNKKSKNQSKFSIPAVNKLNKKLDYLVNNSKNKEEKVWLIKKELKIYKGRLTKKYTSLTN